MRTCLQCGRENSEDARFCSACGARLDGETRAERKVVSVLFADLVGFTSQAEQLDPEDVRATLSPYYARLRSELERRGGTVEKFIGDAVMAVFGAPVAHEDDPERAVRAGLAIRDAIIDDGVLQVRIAVTTGEALVTLGASAAEGEGMVAGDVVNTAARLQGAAPVDGVLVDETTYRATRERIDYATAEPVQAKGKSEPVPVWEAREARSRFGVDVVQAGAPLVGRGRELDLLAGALERAREECSPQLVTLVGVPGIGKSRLVYELQRMVDADPALVYWRQGRSLPYGDGVTYWALAEMVKAQAGILESDAPQETEQKLVETVRALQLPERVLESLRSLVGAGEAEGRGERSEHFAAWRHFLEALAEQRPTVLVFEDLHLADGDLLDFIDHLVDWGSDVPLLVVCTARPELLEHRTGWGGGKPNALTLSISPLSDDETTRLLAALLERAVLPADVQATLLTRAGGNPLYAEQFVRLLEEVGTPEELTVPENVQGIIAARLDGLPRAEKLLLQDASVFGKIFWLGAVSAVGERERDEAEAALHALQRQEFVRRERRASVAGEDEYAFRHVLVRDVAYGQIPRAARAERHERAAAWIDALGRPDDHAEMLAHHYLEALALRRAAGQQPGAALVERARAAARDAGDRALALASYGAARHFYEAALELWPRDAEDRADLLLSYARSRVDDVELEDAVLTGAAEGFLRAGRVEDAAEAEARLGGVWLSRGDGSRARGHFERARELVAERGPSAAKAYVLHELARALMMSDDNERAAAVGAESLRLADELGLDAARSRNLNTIGIAKVRMGDRGGLDDLGRAIEIGSAAGSHEGVSAMANLHSVLSLLGELERAGELQNRVLNEARRLGLTAYVRWQEAELVVRDYLSGGWTEAVEKASAFLAFSAAGSQHYMDAVCLLVRGAIRLARGETADALADARRGAELARPIQDPQSLNPALAVLGRAELDAGNVETATSVADELRESWEGRGLTELFEVVDAAWLFAALGRRGELEAALRQSRLQTPWHEAARRIAAGDAAGAADIYAGIGSVPDEAYARLRAAEAFVGADDRASGDAQLRLARPVFAQLGATAWTVEAEALLAASA